MKENKKPDGGRRDFLKVAVAALAGAGMGVSRSEAAEDKHPHLDVTRILEAFNADLPKDGPANFLKAAKMIADAAKRDDSIKRAAQAVLGLKLTVSETYGKKFNQIRKPRPELQKVKFGITPGLVHVIAGPYAHSVKLLSAPKAFETLQKGLRDGKKLETGIRKMITDTDKDFAGKLITELESRLDSDKKVLERFAAAAADVKKLAPQLANLKGSFDLSKKQTALDRRIGSECSLPIRDAQVFVSLVPGAVPEEYGEYGSWTYGYASSADYSVSYGYYSYNIYYYIYCYLYTCSALY